MRLIIVNIFLLFCSFCQAQTQINQNYPTDSVIKVQIIDSFENDAEEKGIAPEWTSLRNLIAAKYDTSFADRLTNKAQIFYYWGKDWPAFTAALVRYTDKYEDHNNLPLLDRNAKMVLQFGTDKKEMESALLWSKTTVDKEPLNTTYRQTFEALKSKIAEYQ